LNNTDTNQAVTEQQSPKIEPNSVTEDKQEQVVEENKEDTTNQNNSQQDVPEASVTEEDIDANTQYPIEKHEDHHHHHHHHHHHNHGEHEDHHHHHHNHEDHNLDDD